MAGWYRLLISAMLIVHVGLLTHTIVTYSPTVDEVSHLPAGLSHWRFGRFDLYRVNPPLVPMVASVPLLFCEVKEDWSDYSQSKIQRREFDVGRRFVDINGIDAIQLYRYGRLACIPFSLIGAIVAYCFARDLYGRAGGLVALSLWCFSPNVLGNAAIITPDAPSAALALLAVFMFWKWMSAPGMARCVVAGLTLGLAELTKTTCVILYVVLPVMWLIWYWRYRVDRLNLPKSLETAEGSAIDTGSERRFDRECWQMLLIVLLGVYVTNLGYLFDGSFQRLRDYQFVSQTLGGSEATPGAPGNRFRDSLLGAIPVPFPVDYIHGIDLQRTDFEGQRWSYAAGVQNEGGWWWYYLYAMAVKVPHGTMLIVLMAGMASWVRPGTQAEEAVALASRGCQSTDSSDSIEDERKSSTEGLTSPARRDDRVIRMRGDWLILFPALCILVLVSSQTGFSRYIRYLLPAFPFVFVWASRVAQPDLLKRRWWKGLIAFALLWNVWSCVKVHPHHLAFFNEASGGSDNGHWHLLDANVDWGQSSLELKQWLDEREQRTGTRDEVYLSLFAEYFSMRPADIGIEGQPLPLQFDEHSQLNRSAPIDELAPGLYAISVNHLHAYRHTPNVDPDCSEFLQLKPIAIVGSAIQIFELPAERVPM